MSDSRHLDRAIRQALRQRYPTEPQGNLARHLSTLAGMVTGIVLGRSCHLPRLAQAAPSLAEGFVAMFARSSNAPNLGAFSALWSLADILFILGSLVFGIATFRAGVLSRWAAGLFTVGIGLAPAYGLLPASLQPLVAPPIGLGLAWLGLALLTERRPPASGQSLAHLRQTGAE